MEVLSLIVAAIAAIPGVIALIRYKSDSVESDRRLAALEAQAEALLSQTSELQELVNLTRASKAEEAKAMKRESMPQFVANGFEQGTINAPMTYLLKNVGANAIIVSISPIGDEHFNYNRGGNASVPNGENAKIVVAPRGKTIEDRNNEWSREMAHFEVTFEDAHKTRYSQQWDVKSGKFGDPYPVKEL